MTLSDHETNPASENAPPNPAKPTWRARLQRWRANLAAKLGPHPHLYFPLYHTFGGDRTCSVSPKTELVIEGYPRSANTFATLAFRFAQQREVRIAHHIHSPAQILRACGWKVPCVVLIREPTDAAVSLVIRLPAMTLRDALRNYVRFYQPLLAYRETYVLARFKEVTTDFGGVIRRINARFGTDFAEFEHTAANEEKCFEAMGCSRQSQRANAAAREQMAARPSESRQEQTALLRAQLKGPDLAREVEQARQVYEAQIACD